MRVAYKHLAKDVNCEAILCEDGEQAVSHIEEADLLITDLNMGKINGIELAKIARRQRPQMPIIIVTGSPEDVPPQIADQIIDKYDRFFDLIIQSVTSLLRR